MRIPFISLIAASAAALGGCAYGGLGLGYGDPYGYNSYGGYGGYGSPYGYGGGYGYNSGYGYGYGTPYGYGSSYGYGYGSPYYGWNDGYYYPGTGYYVYDSYRQPHYWNDSQRSYWQSRQPRTTATRVTVAPNWGGFTQRHPLAASAQQRRADVIERRSERMATRTQRASDSTDSTTDRPRRRR